MLYKKLLPPVFAALIASGCVESYYDEVPQAPAQPPATPAPIEVPAGTPVVIVVMNGQPVEATAAAPVGLARSWSGVWTTPSGYKCSFQLQLDTDERGWLDGFFVWKLLDAPRGSSQRARIGQTGREYVRGSYDPVARRLDLEGYEVDNPRLLVTDDYRLVLDATGTRFAGRSRGDRGNWVDQLDGQVATP